MDEIHQMVSKALSEHCSIRILGDVRTEALDPNNYLASITDLVRPFLDTWNSKDENTRVTFLAVDIYIRHSFFTRTRPVPFFEDHSDQTKRVICMDPRGEQPEFLKEGAIILNE